MNNKTETDRLQPTLTRNIVKVFWVLALFFACSGSTPFEQMTKSNFELPPAAEIQAIKKQFPHAIPFTREIDSLLNHLKQFDIYPKSMLWGQSICVDDITNTKDRLPSEIKGPFNIGGLAGIPFTGITGLEAFTHHVPDDGTAILFIGPHIGYNTTEGWGKILRHEQHLTSGCCGALVGALTKLQKGELSNKAPSHDDYQEGVIEQFAYAHRKEILSSPEPLITLTQLTYHEAIRQMAIYAPKITEKHFRYVVIIGGIIINTDHTYTDYISVETIAIRDVQRNVWVEGAQFSAELKPNEATLRKDSIPIH